MMRVESHGNGWAVIDETKGVGPDSIVAVYPIEDLARKHAQFYNKEVALSTMYTGGGAAHAVTREDVKRGCTCARGVMLPGDVSCPIHR